MDELQIFLIRYIGNEFGFDNRADRFYARSAPPEEEDSFLKQVDIAVKSSRKRLTPKQVADVVESEILEELGFIRIRGIKSNWKKYNFIPSSRTYEFEL